MRIKCVAIRNKAKLVIGALVTVNYWQHHQGMEPDDASVFE